MDVVNHPCSVFWVVYGLYMVALCIDLVIETSFIFPKDPTFHWAHSETSKLEAKVGT